MSAFYDLASLVVVPSGYKAAKVYAQKPLTTDGQLAFTRASTATRVNASGLVASVASGVPRLDYLNSTCPKLLLEPQRTNSITYSEQLDNAFWTKDNGTVTANAIASPDGSTNADLFIENTSTGNHRVYGSSITGGTNQPLTFSVFAKYNGRQYVYLRTDVIVPKTAVFDIQNGTTGEVSSGSSSKIENYGNGWYRLTLTVNAVVGNTAVCEGLVGLLNGNSYANNSYTGNGTAGAYIWGFQVELDVAYATSYIPTTTAAVTRVADAATKTSATALIGQTEGTLFAEIDFNGTGFGTDNDFFIYVGNGSNTNSIYIDYFNNLFRFIVFTGGSLTAYFDTATTNGTHKIALAYKSGSYAAYKDGVQIGVDAAVANPPTCSIFSLGGGATSFGSVTNNTKQALLFKTRLTNAQLAELTAL
jgi:hypothetical protein